MINTTSPERPEVVLVLSLINCCLVSIVPRGHFIIHLVLGFVPFSRNMNFNISCSLTTPGPERHTGTGNDVM